MNRLLLVLGVIVSSHAFAASYDEPISVVRAFLDSFKENGVAMRAPAQMTFALQNESDGWLITGWAYSAPRAEPAP